MMHWITPPTGYAMGWQHIAAAIALAAAALAWESTRSTQS